MVLKMRRGISPSLLLALLLIAFIAKVDAFGAGNIASVSTIEGKNWRHGDIEDVLKTIVFTGGHKWTSSMVKRVYFGNWLRDYSQAMDVGTLKCLSSDTIRILIWVLSFMAFGYATEEYEVTAERLGVYRPEEHIDNPKDYADNQDARQYDSRLRPPIRQIELQIDSDTGMKNYIANERGDWATSSGYVKKSLSRSIHFGRLYTSRVHSKGKEEDLCEALRCLGQALHTLEDFGAHSNYCELALREMGFHDVFPHTGTATQMNLHGHYVFPLVTGSFGMVDFFHSVLGEANDHFTQSELGEMDTTLRNAQSGGTGPSGLFTALSGLLRKIPGTNNLIAEAEELKRGSDQQEYMNQHRGANSSLDSQYGCGNERVRDRKLGISYGQIQAPAPNAPPAPGVISGSSGQGLPGSPDFDPQATIRQIYPILQFRDKVARTISSIIEKIPKLEVFVQKLNDTVTLFVFSLLAPFIRPIINAASQSLRTGSTGVINASGRHQYEPWTDPHCSDPTHSLLSKDHFANILNEPAGQVAAAILKYAVPRVLYAWEHIDVSTEQILNDCLRVFHHPALRDIHNEAHRTMYEAVQSWVHSRPDRGANLNDILSAESVRFGRNLTEKGSTPGHSHNDGRFPVPSGAGYADGVPQQQSPQFSSAKASPPWSGLLKLPIPGISNLDKISAPILRLIPGKFLRDEPNSGSSSHPPPSTPYLPVPQRPLQPSESNHPGHHNLPRLASYYQNSVPSGQPGNPLVHDGYSYGYNQQLGHRDSHGQGYGGYGH